MEQQIKWPAHIGMLRITHNAHKQASQSAELYWCEQSAFEHNPGIYEPFISRDEMLKSVMTDELWEMEYQPDRSSKRISLWAQSFQALIDYVNDPENLHG